MSASVSSLIKLLQSETPQRLDAVRNNRRNWVRRPCLPPSPWWRPATAIKKREILRLRH